MISLEPKLPELFELIKRADDAIMEIYNAESAIVTTKADNTPLTQADVASHDILTAGLARLFPDIPIVSEEGDEGQHAAIIQAETFWLIDPIDGTKEFLNRSGDFTVCVALVEAGVPTFGIVSAPAYGELYYGGPETGSFKKTLAGRTEQLHTTGERTGIVLGSRNHASAETLAYIAEHYPNSDIQAVGSQLKFTRIAEGLADAYPRIGSSMKLWDVAAGDAILVGAGGKIVRPDGSVLNYREPSLLIGDFVAAR